MDDVQLLYAVSAAEYYQQMAAYSLLSARAFSPRLKIKIRVFGKIHSCLRLVAKRDPNTEVLAMNALDPRIGPVLKWIALAQTESRRVLFVDADTCFMESPERILSTYRKADIYADVERGTTSAWRRGNQIIKKRIDDAAMERLLARFGSRRKFVPFSGAMLFNRSAHRLLAEEMPLFLEIYHGFLSKQIPYPCTLPYMADEVVAGLIIGRLKLKIRHFKPSTITHLNDWFSNPGEFGPILHFNSKDAPRGYQLMGLEEEAKQLITLRKEMRARYYAD